MEVQLRHVIEVHSVEACNEGERQEDSRDSGQLLEILVHAPVNPHIIGFRDSCQVFTHSLYGVGDPFEVEANVLEVLSAVVGHQFVGGTRHGAHVVL